MSELFWKNNRPTTLTKVLGVGVVTLAFASTAKSSPKSPDASAPTAASAACSETLAELLATPESTHRRKIRLPNGVIVHHSHGGGFQNVHILDGCNAQAYDANPDHAHPYPLVIVGDGDGTHYTVDNQMREPLSPDQNPTASQMQDQLHGQ